MELADEQVNEFIALYEKHYGVVLDREDAIQKGVQLIRFVELVECDSEEVNENMYGNRNT